MKAFLCVVFVMALTALAEADVVLSATALNDALKGLERLTRAIATSNGVARADSWFALGVEADKLATLINAEVAAHGDQEKGLIDLGLRRAREIGVLIAYDAERKWYAYDRQAFQEYVSASPRGAHASEAAFKVIERDFFRSIASDTSALLAASERKLRFLRDHHAFPRAAEIALMLAVDYRDLYRAYRDAKDAPRRDRYRLRARQQLQQLPKRYPHTEQAQLATRMLQRFDEEVRTAGP